MAAQIKAVSNGLSARETKSKALSADVGAVIRLANSMWSEDQKIRSSPSREHNQEGSRRRSGRSRGNTQCSVLSAQSGDSIVLVTL